MRGFSDTVRARLVDNNKSWAIVLAIKKTAISRTIGLKNLISK